MPDTSARRYHTAYQNTQTHFLSHGCRNVLTEHAVKAVFRTATVRLGGNRRQICLSRQHELPAVVRRMAAPRHRQ
ncbi:hypothetical protein A7P89_10390 [Eikenella corrodens]|uniref:Uncharacterized protein n=1 Tax=Eikenella corrodens TaxID=539 RepID=A0A1A9RMA5_EIKCO|nr:hypothetical protein [Eikenella corrodens]OAM20303.1 hypothetical protein A7P89_10390 [Eikenella corrodens]